MSGNRPDHERTPGGHSWAGEALSAPRPMPERCTGIHMVVNDVGTRAPCQPPGSARFNKIARAASERSISLCPTPQDTLQDIQTYGLDEMAIHARIP
jgi:hypothetical protein